MKDDRRKMNAALKAIVVPKIRDLGFSGSFPHFRRKRGTEHQLLMLFFSKYGGSFYIEAARQSDDEFRQTQKEWEAVGKPLLETQLTVGHCGYRVRLGGPSLTSNHWFVFGPENNSTRERFPVSPSHYEDIANHVAAVVDSQSELFFSVAP